MENKIVNQNAIFLKEIKFPEFTFKSHRLLISKASQQQKEVEMDISYRVLFHRVKKDEFIVKFNLELHNKEDEKFKGKLVMAAVFETEQPMDEYFKESDFVQLNAPAIAFPYLRSFVTTVTTLAGYRPIMLPTINLSRITKQDNENN